MLNRRDFLKRSSLACISAPRAPFLSRFLNTEFRGPVRCINVVNFIRGVEPRFATDLMLPVRNQMEIILEHQLPATWLLQFDALIAGEFGDFLKSHKAEDHEVGFWFEMNQKLCDAAEVEWRGRPGYEWDHLPPVAFTIGYTPDERIKLADTAMSEFKRVWGYFPKSVASWNLDAITMAHMTSRYKIDAYAVCRDQIATDGFTIWGAPIAGYYPSKTNCWSPALNSKNQINTPVFRMLGQDPVHYYSRGYRLPDGKVIHEPDTMEPVWTSGRSNRFIEAFLKMIARDPCLRFAYAQLGQENSFPWPDMALAYPVQMKALAGLRDSGAVHVETMGETGRRFKKAFGETPAQAQIMLDDPLTDSGHGEITIWYQSRFYRADLHVKDGLPHLRDLTVYSDKNEQPFLNKATRQNDVEQRMPAVLDGYHWSKNPGSLDEIGAGGFFLANGERLRLSGRPIVRDEQDTLSVELPIVGGKTLKVRFTEESVTFILVSMTKATLSVSFEWDPARAALKDVRPQQVHYNWKDFQYGVKVVKGFAAKSDQGWTVSEVDGQISLQLKQPE